MATQSVKDILGRETPTPSFVMRPRREGVLPEAASFSRTNTTRAWNQEIGKFQTFSAGTPRIHDDLQNGDSRGLYVEGGRTQQQRHSSDFTEWKQSNVDFFANKESVLEGVASAASIGSTGAANDSIQNFCGSLPNGYVTFYAIIEKSSAGETTFRVQELGGYNVVGGVRYDWSESAAYPAGGDTFSTVGYDIGPGPNGGRLAYIQGRFKAFDVNGTDYSGTNARGQFLPDPSGSNNFSLIHHAQIEFEINAGNPIVSQGANEFAQPDELTFDATDLWGQEATIVLELTPYYQGSPTNSKIISEDGGNAVPLFSPSNVPLGVRSWDGNTNVVVTGEKMTSRQQSTLAVSFTPDVRRVAIDGATESGGHNGSLVNISTLRLGEVGSASPKAYSSVRVLPKALLEPHLASLTA